MSTTDHTPETLLNERGEHETPESPLRAEYLSALEESRRLIDDAQGTELVVFQCADPRCSDRTFDPRQFVQHRNADAHETIALVEPSSKTYPVYRPMLEPAWELGHEFSDGSVVTEVGWHAERGCWWYTTRKDGIPHAGGPAWFVAPASDVATSN